MYRVVRVEPLIHFIYDGICGETITEVRRFSDIEEARGFKKSEDYRVHYIDENEEGFSPDWDMERHEVEAEINGQWVRL